MFDLDSLLASVHEGYDEDRDNEYIPYIQITSEGDWVIYDGKGLSGDSGDLEDLRKEYGVVVSKQIQKQIVVDGVTYVEK